MSKGRFISPQVQRLIDILREYYLEHSGSKLHAVPKEDPLSAGGVTEGF